MGRSCVFKEAFLVPALLPPTDLFNDGLLWEPSVISISIDLTINYYYKAKYVDFHFKVEDNLLETRPSLLVSRPYIHTSANESTSLFIR